METLYTTKENKKIKGLDLWGGVWTYVTYQTIARRFFFITWQALFGDFNYPKAIF